VEVMAEKKPAVAIVVSQTHWDRAWYLPFEKFRIRLVRLTEKLLRIVRENPRFRFTFDGQTVVLEDILQIRPEWEAELKEHISAGRIMVGPWYVLPDEFLVSGEALIRNLLIGHRIARKFGRVLKVGYIPDPFGHIAQLPQILNGFGLDTFIFMRGMGDEGEELGSEFWWVAPDGESKVLAHHQITSYCNAGYLGYVFEDGVPRVDYERATEHIKRLLENLRKYATVPVFYISNGCDHFEPQPELPDILKHLNRMFDDVQFVQATPEEFFAHVKRARKEFKSYQGEMRAARYHYLLSGVFSSRIYLKQANFRCQTLLERWVEPFCAIAHFAVGHPYPDAHINYAWRTLLKNHPHDDICGCSVDEVHKENETRYMLVEQVGDMLLSEALSAIALRIDTATAAPSDDWQAFAVFNPLPWDRNDPVAVTVPQAWLKHGGTLKDCSGSPVPVQIVQTGDEHALVLIKPPIVPSLGYTTLYLDRTDKQKREWATDVRAEGNTIENEFLRVTAEPNGTITVVDKLTGKSYSGFNLLEDTEDAGDEYDYSPAENSQTITSENVKAKVKVVESGPVRASLLISYDLQLPESLTPDRKGRSNRMVRCPVQVKVSLNSGVPRVDFEVTVTNNAKDHRLRALFPTDIQTDVAKVEEHFHVIERSLTLPEGKNWAQPPQPTNHMDSFVSVDDGAFGVTVISEGLPEYEVRKDAKGVTICLTLLRCVGWLSRGDFKTRPGHAGPQIATPDAQCLGTHTFRYAVAIHKRDWRESGVMRLAHEHNVPMRIVPARRKDQKHPAEAPLPVSCSFLRVEPADFFVTAVKRAEDRDSLIVRFYNTRDTGQGSKTEGRICLWCPPKEAHLTNLNEERKRKLRVGKDGSVQVSAKAWQIVTTELVL
jgi:mannosylglycerate hydrolase